MKVILIEDVKGLGKKAKWLIARMVMRETSYFQRNLL